MQASCGLARSHEQDTARAQGHMQPGDGPLLCIHPEIDEEVSATDEVDTGEGRVGEDVVLREQHQRPQLRGDPVGLITFGNEESLQPSG